MKHVKGDLLDFTHCKIIAHQVNTAGVMGAGLAAQIALKYPDVLAKYKRLCDAGVNKLGTGFEAVTSNGVIYNMFAQSLHNSPYGVPTNYHALTICLLGLKDYMKSEGYFKVGLPKFLGCGLGGGKWEIVEEIIEMTLGDMAIIVEWSK